MTQASVGYQIFPDRFCCSEKKPGILSWEHPIKRKPMGAHQLEFYGGDLRGILSKIEYLESLGIEFLFLNPIFKAQTNHRYDTTDFFQLDPLLGTESDFRNLSGSLHQSGIRLVLDAVWNHIGHEHPWAKEPKHRDFLLHRNGSPTGWSNSNTLPELNLENPQLRNLLWNGPESVAQKWMRLGADDWRLDCAYDLGFRYCREITQAIKTSGTHRAIGEVWSYPGLWLQNETLDGVMNYWYRELILCWVNGEIDANTFVQQIAHAQKDCSLDGLLNSWNMLSSHDTPRIRHQFPLHWPVAIACQFTLPGSPILYYGEELGLVSEGDPYCRQPMPWDRVHQDHPDIKRYQEWIRLFRGNPALNRGAFYPAHSTNPHVCGFWRKTSNIADNILVVINASANPQAYRILCPDSLMMNNHPMRDRFTGTTVSISNSTIRGEINPLSCFLFQFDLPEQGYSPYKRLIDEDIL